MKLFKEREIADRKNGSGGNNKSPGRTVLMVKRGGEIKLDKKLSKTSTLLI